MMFGGGGSKWSSGETEEDDTDSWVVTFADMSTLLLAFFILLASISKVDAVLFEQVKAGIQEGVGKREVKKPIEELKKDTGEVIKALQVEDVVGLGQDQDGVVIEFASSAFYTPGSADIRAEALPVLEQIIATLNEPRYQGFQIEVQGHTDDTPINTAQFPSNWELAGARATGVLRFMLDQGVSKERVLAVSYADVAPKVPNRTPEGQAIPLNQELNRRIAVRIFPKNQF
ncbi:OmpA/MotB family protein [Pararhodospirillum photometricum]|uniref:OmpA/MotB n=1 Tax=Pararhodospirillum photometricum DSM 122 TaxID=1150469 RepID=H6SIK2_PARPM|nr:OmpA family protein [Pararhodospirillum photometricum]CCG06629.1 OmpA/MotB [Pararhodospirillum photometricum DSM 122]